MVRTTTTFVLAVALALALALAPPPATGAELFTAEDMESDDSMWALYERWGARYEVVRDAGEKLRRFGIFKETARRVYAAHPGDRHYTLGLNVFADRTTDEVRAAYACERPVDGGERHVNAGGKLINVTPPPPEEKEALPDTVDWRTADCNGHPCVTKVKDQGDCGCCWAMSAAGALESLNAIQRNNGLVDLSVQQLVDCDTRNEACRGGFAFKAFDYIINNGGLASEAAYPYRGRQDTYTCQAAAKSPVVAMAGFNRVAAFLDVDLMFAVKFLPVVVAIDASDDSFSDYPGGVYRGPCGHSLNHEMLLVGYGTTGTTFDDLDYWIVKNSYGEGWGENGYMRIQRNINRDTEDSLGICGILMDAIYPYMEWID